MHELDIGGMRVGPAAECFVAAEIGINHNGDLTLAHRLIDAAAESGVDGVKFQNFHTEDFISDRSLTYEYESGGRRVVESQFDMFKRYELPEEAFRELQDHCRDAGVVFFSTPTGFSSLAALVRLGVPLLKNGSDYLAHLPLIRAMAESGIPTVLSTGMATIDEIAAAVGTFRSGGGTELVLLHCTSSYPAPIEDVNLRAIPALADRFDCLVGFSDHTEGILAAVGAVALGACFIEKHFTLDRKLPGPDHHFSSDPIELAALVAAVRSTRSARGEGHIGPAPSELLGRRDFRVSCVAARSLPAGHALAPQDIIIRRPGTGIPPGEIDKLLGRALTRAVSEGTPLSTDTVA